MKLWMAFVLAGGFSIAGAWFNWDWFMNGTRSRGIVDLFGREGARIFYGLLGAFVLILGIVLAIWE